MNNTFEKVLDVLIIILTVVVLVLLVLESTMTLTDEQTRYFLIIDTTICFIFLFEFFYKLSHSHRKSAYFKRHWIDFLSSIPFVTFLRAGRVFRLVRLLRFIRIAILFGKQAQRLTNVFSKGSFVYIIFLLIAICIFGATALFVVEKDANAQVNSYYDALWWTVVTITTVGYGDIYPATSEGRVVASILMFLGLGVVASVTAIIATVLIGENNSENRYPCPACAEHIMRQAKKCRFCGELFTSGEKDK